jgi:hypothetical protein
VARGLQIRRLLVNEAPPFSPSSWQGSKFRSARNGIPSRSSPNTPSLGGTNKGKESIDLELALERTNCVSSRKTMRVAGATRVEVRISILVRKG